MTGHDHHFLSRLDRVSDEHVELALGLYRDDVLLRLVMSTCEIGDQVPRVAIALGPVDRGPFLIVARDGGFVTCLGEGMSPGPWPVISRGKLDAISKNIKHLHDKIAFAKRMKGSRNKTVGDRLRDQIAQAGMQLCREDYQAAAALHPLMGAYYYGWMGEARKEGGKLRDRLYGIHRSTPGYACILRKYYELECAASHFALLATQDPEALWARVPAEVLDTLPRIAWVGVREGGMGLALRSLCAAARLGKLILPQLKQLHETAGTNVSLWSFSGGLAAIGMRHPELRAEVLAAMTMPSFDRGHPALTRHMLPIGEAIIPRFRACLQDMDKEVDMAQQLARAVANQTLKDAGMTAYATINDVPLELAKHCMCSSTDSFLGSLDAQIILSAYMPWAMTLEPEEFYAPRAQMKAIDVSWRPQLALELLAGIREYAPRPPPKRAEKKPGPNEACSCGSGKKYKKCCGRAGAGSTPTSLPS
jgi:hypothetical protein